METVTVDLERERAESVRRREAKDWNSHRRMRAHVVLARHWDATAEELRQLILEHYRYLASEANAGELEEQLAVTLEVQKAERPRLSPDQVRAKAPAAELRPKNHPTPAARPAPAPEPVRAATKVELAPNARPTPPARPTPEEEPTMTTTTPRAFRAKEDRPAVVAAVRAQLEAGATSPKAIRDHVWKALGIDVPKGSVHSLMALARAEMSPVVPAPAPAAQESTAAAAHVPAPSDAERPEPEEEGVAVAPAREPLAGEIITGTLELVADLYPLRVVFGAPEIAVLRRCGAPDQLVEQVLDLAAFINSIPGRAHV